MRAIVVIVLWVVSFIGMAITFETLNVWFWLCFALYAFVSLYLEKHGKRLMRELEDKD
jgi:hypothetical protein